MDEKPRRNPLSQTVWLNEQAQIASFHSVVGYEERSFLCRDYFMGFLNNLQERGYRFQ
ncbi:MAG: hypothetical protein SO072_02290 [Dysosmobacter sp.]|nr:hypothetical protein [Dysosmobacter sp.]